MNVIYRILLAVVAIGGLLSGPAAAAGLPSGSTINVLWVGNSLTNTPPDYNDYSLGPLPVRIKPMLAEFGITLNYSARIQGGAEFSDHARNATTMAEIGKTTYDMVNLQGYYEGFGSASAFQTAVKPLYDAARAAGSVVLFEEIWTYPNDPGSPQYPASSIAVETASANMLGSFAVQVGRVWGVLRTTNPTLYSLLFADGTDQNKNGEYLNALVYTRFFSGKSVLGVVSVPPLVATALTAAQRLAIKQAVDANVTIFYEPSGVAPPPVVVPPPPPPPTTALVAYDKSISVVTFEAFRQVNLTSSAEGSVVWSTLQLDKTQFKGTAAVVSTVDAATVNLDYSNGYIGSDLLRWRVQDAAGIWSNWASINILVSALATAPPSLICGK